MAKPVSIDEMVRRLLDTLPPGLADVRSDLRANMRAGLTQVLKDMNLVTREEYELQRRLLARTREKLEQLETRAARLEARMADGDTRPAPRGD